MAERKGGALALEDLPEVVSEALEAASDDAMARKMLRQIQTIRGVRGVPLGELARVTAATWDEARITLPEAARPLGNLFGTAWEDGLVAIGLLAAALPDAPAEALALGLQWAERIDDVATADALGWLVLGPAALLTEEGTEAVEGLLRHARPQVRRAAAMAAMAWLPEPLEGPSAAALRARLGQRHAMWVDAPRSAMVATICDALVRDESPEIRKVMRRVLRSWMASDPAAVADWHDRWMRHGGLPKMLSEETRRARKRAERLAQGEADADDADPAAS